MASQFTSFLAIETREEAITETMEVVELSESQHKKKTSLSVAKPIPGHLIDKSPGEKIRRNSFLNMSGKSSPLLTGVSTKKTRFQRIISYFKEPEYTCNAHLII